MVYRSGESGKIYDDSTLYVMSGEHTVSDVRSYFGAIFSLVEKFSPGFDRSIEINRVERADGSPVGICYVKVSPHAYYALIGRNIDGTERIEEIVEENDSDGDDYNFTDNVAWGDIEDMKKTVIELGPLFQHPVIEDLNITIMPAFVSELEPDLDSHTLCISRFPDHVKADDVHKIFRSFVTNKSATQLVYEGGVKVRKPYPIVSMSRSPKTVHQRCFIHFDKSTHDARFALLMKMKSHVGNSLLIANHARARTRP